MNVKKEIVLEFKSNDNLYRFSMPESAPIGEIYDVGFQILKKSLDLAASAVQNVQAQQQAVSPAVEVVQPQTPIQVAPDADPQNCTNGTGCSESVGT
jgi:hypothetical protein